MLLPLVALSVQTAVPFVYEDQLAILDKQRWTEARAQAWADSHGWLSGANFLPATAINQVEMWQSDTWDPKTIERDLKWAASIGMNSMRVFLHDIAWEQDPTGFKRRVDEYLRIADRHNIKTLFVFFDDCHRPEAKPGRQPAPRPGIHNSGWVQSPSVERKKDPAQWKVLERYVKDTVGAFRADKRVVGWDVYNEPGNSGYGDSTQRLLLSACTWIRACKPVQPLTVGAWGANAEHDALFIRLSDVVSFHTYSRLADVYERVAELKKIGRPLWCTEWLARTQHKVEEVLPLLQQQRVGAINWGLVDGKMQTKFPWGSPENAPEPTPWFHDVFRADGTPYDSKEIEIWKQCRAAAKAN